MYACNSGFSQACPKILVSLWPTWADRRGLFVFQFFLPCSIFFFKKTGSVSRPSRGMLPLNAAATPEGTGDHWCQVGEDSSDGQYV